MLPGTKFGISFGWSRRTALNGQRPKPIRQQQAEQGAYSRCSLGTGLSFSKWLGIYPQWGAIILRVAIAGRATEETMSSRKVEKDGSRDTGTMNQIDAAVALGHGKGVIVGVPGHQTREIAAQDRGTERDETETARRTATGTATTATTATTAGAVRGAAGETTSTTTDARDRSRDATPRTRRDPKEAGA